MSPFHQTLSSQKPSRNGSDWAGRTLSDHQDLDLVVLVWPVEERDAGVFSQEGSGSGLRILDLLQELHDLAGRAVLFGPQGRAVRCGSRPLGTLGSTLWVSAGLRRCRRLHCCAQVQNG